MDISLSWLKKYVPDLNCSDQEFFDAMTLSGTKVESVSRKDKNLERIVVGKIEAISKHPDAEKLVVCKVDIGDAAKKYDIENENGLIQIVTGAPNTKIGEFVPVVLPGGKVAGGHDGSALPENGIEIKAGSLRGVPSNGMMCSIEELGSSRDFYPEAPEEGLYYFDKNSGVKAGDDAIEALGLRDSVYEFEITSNRVDCYSIIGIAREAAATFRKEFVPPKVKFTETSENTADYISVEVEDKELCSRYVARVCTDIKIAPSPVWLQRQLASCGVRPINNLVDITNYVMLEYGQPMHAYDLDTVSGGKIIVKRAKDGEKFTTLDGQERSLDKDVLMICDVEKEIGIAGIMGGENTMITDSVKTVLFEAATFNGTNIRKSSKRIGLRTDASSFFEKGLDPVNTRNAIDRACQLVEELGCGKICQGVVEDLVPIEPLKRISLDAEKINALLGTDISKEEMLEYLKPLEIEYDEAANELIIPSFRQDINALCDIAEEVVRFYGYDKTPMTLPKSTAVTGKLSFDMLIEARMKEVALYSGFSQGYNYSFESPKVFDKLLIPDDSPLRNAIKIANPLGEDFSIMRTVSLNGILTSLAANYNYRNKNVHLFEMGNVYIADELPLKELPDERKQLTLGFYSTSDKEGNFFDMKGVAEQILESVGISKGLKFEQSSERPYLHPGRAAEIFVTGVDKNSDRDNDGKPDKKATRIGFIGEIHPLVAQNYGIGAHTYIAVLDIPSLLPFTGFGHIYSQIARFPALTRDISMVVPNEVSAARIEEILIQRGGKNLESASLFDIYEGEQIKEGFKSMTYSLIFRSAEKTLSDDEVNAAMKKILNGLDSIGVELRG